MFEARHAYRRHLPHFQKPDRYYFITFVTKGWWVMPPPARDLLMPHILFDHDRVMSLYVAVVMPDHAHLILSPYVALGKVTQGIKGASARSINQLVGREGQLWLHESFDHELRQDEGLRKKAEYICMNPVRKGLCNTPDEWPWLWRSWCTTSSQLVAGVWQLPRLAWPRT
ncbi:MAG TPA: hypothetical protein VII75_07590 [Thermoanaerobaculia bacterium]|nr:hypothetical protein [Thermoanaerobaculia bacterium]